MKHTQKVLRLWNTGARTTLQSISRFAACNICLSEMANWNMRWDEMRWWWLWYWKSQAIERDRAWAGKKIIYITKNRCGYKLYQNVSCVASDVIIRRQKYVYTDRDIPQYSVTVSKEKWRHTKNAIASVRWYIKKESNYQQGCWPIFDRCKCVCACACLSEWK